MSAKPRKIVILTGAGISAESGIRTFRDSGGLWEQYRIEDVATPEAYRVNPQLVWKFYSLRRLQAAKAVPNSAHYALAELAAKREYEVHLITQNVDNLHSLADPQKILPPICMHGSLNQSRCTHCGTLYLDDTAYFNEKGDFSPQGTGLCSPEHQASTDYLHHHKLEYREFLPLSPCCQSPIRPHIVWFGEMPLYLAKIDRLLTDCSLFAAIGTSGQVYPAAGFLQIAKSSGAKTVCINQEVIPQASYVDEFIQGKAGEKVPEYFQNL